MNRHQYAAANNLSIIDDNAAEFHAANSDYSLCLTIERCGFDGRMAFYARLDIADGQHSEPALGGSDGDGHGYGRTMDAALADLLANSRPLQPIVYVSVGQCFNTADVDL